MELQAASFERCICCEMLHLFFPEWYIREVHDFKSQLFIYLFIFLNRVWRDQMDSGGVPIKKLSVGPPIGVVTGNKKFTHLSLTHSIYEEPLIAL